MLSVATLEINYVTPAGSNLAALLTRKKMGGIGGVADEQATNKDCHTGE